ncbi:MAG: hypothetical protein WCL14_00325 [Bacteroidota bacterium]
MGEFLKILLIIALSSVKFIAGPPFYYFNKQYSFTFFETITLSVLGGMIGVVAFSYFSDWLFQIWHYIRMHYFKTFKRKELFSSHVADEEGKIDIKNSYIAATNKRKKVFTPKNRRLVRIWSDWGIMGIAFITPVLLSIPLGTIITSRLVHSKRKVFVYMFISILFWSILITSFFELYHVVTLQDLGKHTVR